MPNLLELLTPREVMTYLSSRTFAPKVGDALFPNRKTDSLEMEYIKGANGLPVAATIHSFDSETQIGSRVGAESFVQELALIKRKMVIREKEIIAIANPRNDAELQRLIDARYKDVDTLVEGVLARAEALKMEAVAKGVVTINENGVTGTIDFGVPSAQKIVLSGNTAPTALWSGSAADILGNLQTWADLMKTAGKTVTRAITSTKVLRTIAANAAIKAAIFGTGSDRYVSVNELNAFLESNGLPSFVAYDEQYNVQNGDGTYTAKRYFDENYIALLPAGPLGEGLFGPTAEEVELSGDPSMDVNLVGNILAMVYKTPDPVAHWTKAVATFMPSFPAADSILSAKVL